MQAVPLRTFLQRTVWASLVPLLVLGLAFAALRLQAVYAAEHESAERVGRNMSTQFQQFLTERLAGLTRLARQAEAAPQAQPS